jgi:hypothetical protein
MVKFVVEQLERTGPASLHPNDLSKPRELSSG